MASDILCTVSGCVVGWEVVVLVVMVPSGWQDDTLGYVIVSVITLVL